jgi:hypothetical protein
VARDTGNIGHKTRNEEKQKKKKKMWYRLHVSEININIYVIIINTSQPSDCSDLDKTTCKSGVYKIYPNNTSGFDVYCEMEKNGGGWTVSDAMLLCQWNKHQHLCYHN